MPPSRIPSLRDAPKADYFLANRPRNRSETRRSDPCVRARPARGEIDSDVPRLGALAFEGLLQADQRPAVVRVIFQVGAIVRDLRRLGYQSLPIDALIRLRDQGVSPAYIDELADIGYARLGVEDLVSLRNQGVSPDEVRRANARAGGRLSVERIRELAARGWR
jgi:hypothetical protein